jgi:hypothetical protein
VAATREQTPVCAAIDTYIGFSGVDPFWVSCHKN